MDLQELIIIKEGKALLKVPNPEKYRRSDGVYEPSWAPVFYNPRQALNRDLSILALNVLATLSGFSSLRVLDALAGSGVRALRYYLEVPNVSLAIANDIDMEAFTVIKENIKLNNAEHAVKACKLDANAFMYLWKSMGRTFEFIDIDPFGSPAPFVKSSLWCVRRNGAVGYTATDTAPLSGVKWVAGSRKYDVRLIKTDIPHEVGLRVLLGYICRRAAEIDRFIEPLVTFAKHHYFRTIIHVRKGANKASETIDKCLGYLMYCKKCYYRETVLINDIPRDSLCPFCGGRLVAVGPLWVCNMFHRDFLDRMLSLIRSSEYEYLPTRQDSQELLELLVMESQVNGLAYNVSSPARIKKVNMPPTNAVIDCLRSRGLRASRTHIDGQLIRTNASWADFVECVVSDYRSR